MSVTTRIIMRPSGHIAQVVRPSVKRNLTPRVQRVTDAARAAAPRHTGRMAKSIRMIARDGAGRFSSHSERNPAVVSYEISVQVPYAGFVIRGAGPHIIRSHGDWPLRNRETGQVFGPMVRHPGQKANDFLTPALKAGGF